MLEHLKNDPTDENATDKTWSSWPFSAMAYYYPCFIAEEIWMCIPTLASTLIPLEQIIILSGTLYEKVRADYELTFLSGLQFWLFALSGYLWLA